MSVTTILHINFRGQAREALQFYQSVFGGELALVTYAEAQHVRDPEDTERIMWGQVLAADGFRVMAYDVPVGTPWHAGENSFFACVACDSADETRARWARLQAGATVAQPLEPSSWSPLYGMLKDRFGVAWVLSLAAR